MSSYFDRMARCMNNSQAVVALVRDQYRWYLRKLSEEVLAKDAEQLYKLSVEFDNIKDNELCKQNPDIELGDMHQFAHKLGQARIRLRGGRYAMDNPPIPY